MAAFLTYYRNRSESDTETYQASLGSDALFINDTGFTNPDYAFVIWNTHSDGTGTNIAPGTSTVISGGFTIMTLYAIWEPNIDYMVTKSELSSIASAIRGKTKNNIPLTYPNDFISELNNIQPGEMTTFLSGSSLPASNLGTDGDFYTYTGS